MTRAPGPVRFTRARMTGSSVGASYDRQRDVLWMLDQAHITVAPDDKGAGGADVTAGAAGYAKRDRYIRFERGVKMRRGPQLITADGAVVTLEAAADVVEQIELRGSAQVAGVGQGANGLESMRSRDMNLGMADDGQTLQQATLVGEAVVRVAGGANAPGAAARRPGRRRRDRAPTGSRCRGSRRRTTCSSICPPPTPARRRGGSGRARSTPTASPACPACAARASTATSSSARRRRRRKDKPAVERVVRAPTLETKLQSGLGTIDRATFTEGVSVKDGTRTAQGPTMIYDVAQGTIALASPAGATGFVQVSDERVNIEARLARVDARRHAHGRADQRQERAQARRRRRPDRRPSSGPSMLTADQPINVTAATMTYNQQTGHAEYTGDAQLWQGATSIRAKTITLDEATGNLTAKDAVRSVMRVETKSTAKPEATAADKAGRPRPRRRRRGRRDRAAAARRRPRAAASRGPGRRACRAAPPPRTAPGSAAGKGKPAVLASDTIATANELVYDDAERRARYTGTARMVGERGDLRGERIELYFDESGRGVSRLEGFDNVRFSLKARPGGEPRWGNGGRLTYFADEERYVLSGPRAHRGRAARRAAVPRDDQGRTLTFFSSNDSVVVDSDNNSRTLTQTGTSCQEPTQ